MNKKEIIALQKFLPQKNIVIVTHKNPDGDALGSSLALYGYLKKITPSVRVIVPNEFPHYFKWMPYADTILNFDTHKDEATQLLQQADLIFTLDFNHFSRVGADMQQVLETTSAVKVMIDHHLEPDNYAKFVYSDSNMSSTAQMIYHFIEMMDDLELIDEEIATNMYTGIMTDTGSFRYRSTTATTHRIIASLIERGANNTEIHQKIYDTNSYHRLQLLATALNQLVVFPDYRTAYLILDKKSLEKHHVKKGDYEGFVNYALSIESIVLAAIFVETPDENFVKISFRSKGTFSVNEFARMHFHGGGHTNAAGGKSFDTLEQTVKKFIATLDTYKKQLTDEN
jgi:phosphoesterase RecJ-like protein